MFTFACSEEQVKTRQKRTGKLIQKVLDWGTEVQYTDSARQGVKQSWNTKAQNKCGQEYTHKKRINTTLLFLLQFFFYTLLLYPQVFKFYL